MECGPPVVRERGRGEAHELGMSEGAVKVAVHGMRVRFGELLRRELAQTLEDRADIDQETRFASGFT